MSATEHVHHAQRLLERLPLVTYTLRRDPDTPLVYLSPQIESTFGFALDDFDTDAEFWRNHLHPDDRETFAHAVDGLRETGERMEVEYRVLSTNGHAMWVRDTASVDGDLIHGYLVDITREKELEQDLARERATLDAFFHDSAIGLAITDGEGRYVRINQALARLNGVPADEHIGRTLADVAPEVAAVVDPLRAKALDGGDFHVELQERDRHAILSYFPFEVDGERFHGRVVLDVTAQRRAEAAERMYRQLIEQLPLVAYVNDIEPRHRATFVSPGIEALTGYTPERFLSEPEIGNRMIHPADMDTITERETVARQLGRPFEHEYRIVRADGEVRWVLDRMETVYDDAGVPLHEQGFLVDITETHETASLLRAVWDGALDGMVIADDDGRFIDANPAALELFGRSREELVGAHVYDFTESPDSIVVRPDGERREIEGSARAEVIPGHHLGVLRDVTEHRQLQHDLWRAQKLESVGRLAGGVAHDFNNLLTAIRGYAQLLHVRLAAGSVEEQHVLEIDRAADRAAALTAQLLALGRRQTLQARPLNLNRHLDTIFDSLAELAGPRHELVFELEPALRAVRVDDTLFAQAVRNLVSNATDAMADGGTIVIRTANADVEGRDDLTDGAYVVLSVVDTGHGLDEATLEHVFEPFFTTKELGAGNGLGLASAYGTVKQSGGTIDVESTPGAGAMFSIYLPEASAGDVMPARRGEGETILVVEPDPAVRDVLFELLTDANYRVLTTRTTVEALRLAERVDGPIDLLLTDLEGARLDELAASLRGKRPALEALSLEKPYTPERLQRAVRDALESPERGREITVSA